MCDNNRKFKIGNPLSGFSKYYNATAEFIPKWCPECGDQLIKWTSGGVTGVYCANNKCLYGYQVKGRVLK